MVGSAGVLLATSSSLWSVRDFRWRDAGPRTREKASPAAPSPASLPPSPRPLRPPPGRCRREAAAPRGGWSRSRGPGCARVPLPRGTLEMGRSAFKFAGSGRIHVPSRGSSMGPGGLGWWDRWDPDAAPRAQRRCPLRAGRGVPPICCRACRWNVPRGCRWGVSATTGLVLHLGSWALAPGTL